MNQTIVKVRTAVSKMRIVDNAIVNVYNVITICERVDTMTQAGIYYADDLTIRAEESVERLIALHVDLEDRKWDSQVTADKIKDNLADIRNSINVAAFLRRYLVEHWLEIVDWLILGYKKNVKKPKEDIIKTLAEKKAICRHNSDEINGDIIEGISGLLFAVNKDIAKTQWIGWLNGDNVPRREQIFKIAIILKMSVEDTVKLLLVCGCEPYSFRDPRDLICWYYQSSERETYTWSDVTALLDEFRRKALPNIQGSTGAIKPTIGGTKFIKSEIDIIKNQSLDANPDKNLVEYMVNHSNEFITFPTKKKAGHAPLPGYSRDKMNKMIRLALCLEKLYPYFDQVKDTPCESMRPVLPELTRAMFKHTGWTKIDWEKASEGSTDLKMEAIRACFCESYINNHITAVQSMRKEGNSVEFFNRRDALLFTFFLISGYITDRGDPKRQDTVRKDIAQILQPENDFDYSIDLALSKALAAHDEEPNEQDRFEMYRESFNIVLTELGYHKIYMPSVLDRFFLLALMSDNPAKLAAMIMGQVVDSDSSDTILIDLLKIPADLEQRLALCRQNNGKPKEKKQRKENPSAKQAQHGDLAVLSESQSDTEILEEFVMPELRAGDPYAMYRAEIKDIPILTEEQEVALLQLVAQGNMKARNKIVEHNLRLVADIAGKYYGRGVDLLDLIQEGNKKLMETVDKFDLSKGNKFSTYAYRRIEGAIQRTINEYSHTIHIPEEQLQRMRKICKFEDEFSKEFGRSPTLSEISQELQLSENQIIAAKRSCLNVLSLDAPSSAKDDTYSLNQMVADPSNSSPDEIVMCEETNNSISFLLDSLDEREALVLKLLYALYDGYQYSEANLAFVFELDKGLIVQIRDSTLANLRHHSYVKMMKNYYC